MSDGRDLNKIFEDTKARMNKTISVFESELKKIRTGRASSSLVDHIKVDYYGTHTPLSQLATISVPETKTILIQPWDVNAVQSIERAIMQSDLGINPTNDGKVIRINIPVLTEERRRELAKYIAKLAEDYRVSIRNIRKDLINEVRQFEKDSKMPEDEVKRNLTKIQEITDSFIEKINQALERKEKEIKEI